MHNVITINGMYNTIYISISISTQPGVSGLFRYKKPYDALH